uniref:cAMP responsive element binding protein 5 n=1 Tax=Latimeria chalumnae TaxID=7897 RepID=H3B5S5_LATCH
MHPMASERVQRLKAALAHHPAAMSNGNMNTMGHMMDMMSSRQDQGPHHHMHSHPHQHQTLPPHHPYPHQHQHQHQHQQHPHHPQHHHQQNHPHHHSHPHLHAHPPHHQSSPHPPLHTGAQAQVSPAAQQMQPTQTIQQPQPTGGRRRRVVDEDPDERRRKFLERNRAAATRCRQKRKVWVMSLEKKAEELTQTNMQLQNEVSMLKTEVSQLKQLLLTHKDCPITAMQKESQGYLSPESSPPESPVPTCSQQQVIQHNTITTSSSVNDVVGSSALSQLASHRTDMNPIL